MRRSKTAAALVCAAAWVCVSSGADMEAESPPAYQTVTNILYREGAGMDDAGRQACRLDVYFPTQIKDFSTVVWFHGGGLTSGSRWIPAELKEQEIAVVAADYRLSPEVVSPVYIEDAAAAVAWTVQHIEQYGGSREKIFVSGHSAGGYLTSMVGLDERWLAGYGVDAKSLAGLIPFSGHAITHFTVRAERGIDRTQPVVDDLAPLFHVRPDAPPLLLITGDRELEMLGRYEENAYLWRMMKVGGHPDTSLIELKGCDHGQMVEAAFPYLLQFVRSHETLDELQPVAAQPEDSPEPSGAPSTPEMK